MKNKKIISLVCALAMVFSMFSAFTVVNAENTKGIALTGEVSKDLKVITINAEATGTTTDKLNSFKISLNVPAGVELTAENVESKVVATSPHGKPIIGFVNGNLNVGVIDMTGDGIAFTNKKLAEIKITLDTPLSSDYVATLQDESTFDDGDEIKVGKGTMDAATVKIQDPNKKPDTEARPGENTDPDDTPTIPSDKPVTSEKGIALKASLDKTGKIVTIEAEAAGTTTDKLNSFKIALNVPDKVELTAENVESKVVATSPHGKPIIGFVNGNLNVGVIDMTGDGIAFTNKKLAEIKITLDEAITDYFEFTLQDDSTFDDGDEVKVGKGTMTASSAVAKPETSEVKPAKTEALKNYVGNGYEAAIAAVPDGKAVYLNVYVTDKDGNAAAYGTDYVAEYPAGTKLTKKQYENLIHGYTDANMADVINGLKFNIYNTTNAKHIKTTLNAEDQETQLVDPVDKDFGGKEPTPTKTPAKLTLTAKVEAKKLYVENATSINVDVKSGLHTVKNGDTVEYLIPANDKFIKFFTDADPSTKKVDGKDYKVITKTISNATEDEAPTATSTVNIKALSVTGTTKMLVNYYDGEIEKDEAPVAETSVSVKVQKKTDGGSGSSDDDDDDDDNTGSGPIAGWNGQTGNTALGQFTDLETVDWAKQAITMLAMKGIVSGDGNGLFRPNDNITRAEYCQILIGAINKTNEYADSSFADVPSDAWFYHAVAVASANGIVSGYGDGNFGPYDLITRQDMALMTYKAAQVMNKDMSAVRTMSFADGGAISDYAATAVQTLADAGIINGVSDTEFAPRANATRAQAAKILYDTFVK